MNALAKVLIHDTPIDWDRYVLTQEDLGRFVNPNELVGRISDVVHGRGAREGVPLPWAGLQDKVRLRRGKFAVWAGINHHGKTAMLKQIALHLVRSGERVCMASLEEDPEETMADIATLAMPDVDLRETDEYIDLACNWSAGKLWLYNQTKMMDPQRILALMAYAAQEKRCTHFILDSLMRTGIAQDDYDGQRIFCNHLTNYGSRLNLGVQLVHHIVKVDESQVPGRESIRGSGAIIDQSDQTFIVWRDMNEDKALEAPDGLLIVAKNRGRRPLNWIGKIQMHMHSSGQFMRNKFDKPMQFIGGMQ